MKYKNNKPGNEKNLTIDELITNRVTKNINELHGEKLSFGDKLADKLAQFASSWRFIIIFFSILLTWIGLNSVQLFFAPFDPFPFILLNLILSCVASIQAPVIMMSQNRQEEKNQLMAEQNYKVDLKQEVLLEQIYQKMNKLEEDIKKIEDSLNLKDQ